MELFSTIDPARARRIRYILCDIDDTITTGGKLTAEAYAALWRLHDAGYGVIPVTGRPAALASSAVSPTQAISGAQ